jgi:hypothetical protein
MLNVSIDLPAVVLARRRPAGPRLVQVASPDDTALAGRRRESWRATYVRARDQIIRRQAQLEREGTS